MGKEIDSDTVLPDFDTNLHVSAGPGAGKTYWLVRHIRNIQQNSRCLKPSTRIACISYTNIAVEQVRSALGIAADTVDVSTIHSFLFVNIVRPYLHLLSGVDGKPLVNVNILDSHLEHRPSYKRVDEWLRSVGRVGLRQFQWPDVMKFLQKASWRLNEQTGEWTFRAHRSPLPGKYFPATKLDTYKSFYWRDGIVDHDDILHLSHRILTKYPVLGKFLALRYPYLLVDEFQDTSPVQAALVKWMADQGSTVTVVGDAEQAIYGFQGASVEAFLTFKLAGQENLTISGNRRSTMSIVELLNSIRQDSIQQYSLRPESGAPVQIFVGDTTSVVTAVEAAIGCGEEVSNLAILARSNAEVAAIRLGSSFDIDRYWGSMVEVDRERARLLRSCCEAAGHIRDGLISTAFVELRSVVRVAAGKLGGPFRFDGEVGQSDRDAITVLLARFLSLANREMQSASILDIYQGISKSLEALRDGLSLAKVKGGKFAEVAQSVSYGSLVPSETTSASRYVGTIHKSKGAQFPNVLVVFSEDFNFGDVLDATCVGEERRIAYVGLSRAMNRLFIGVPQLVARHEEHLRSKGCLVERIY